MAVFNTLAEGQDALWSLLQSSKYKGKTITEFVHTYAPEKDGNDEAAYVAVLVDAIGIYGMTADTRLKGMLETSMSTFVRAIRRQEGWVEGTVTWR
jgi:hypothetical protein